MEIPGSRFKDHQGCDDELVIRAVSLDKSTPVARRIRKATELRRSAPGSPSLHQPLIPELTMDQRTLRRLLAKRK